MFVFLDGEGFREQVVVFVVIREQHVVFRVQFRGHFVFVAYFVIVYDLSGPVERVRGK
jgi:hypothetical protein